MTDAEYTRLDALQARLLQGTAEERQDANVIALLRRSYQTMHALNADMCRGLYSEVFDDAMDKEPSTDTQTVLDARD